MQSTNIPSKFPLPFAYSGTKNAIPTASQIGIKAGAASLTDGFPPLTFTPLAAGGVPPSGADFNGILNMLSLAQQWENAGGSYSYDSTFSTSIGGYPKGAVLIKADLSGFWLNQVDNNAANPDTGGANWIGINENIYIADSGAANAYVLAYTPAISAYANGQRFIFKITNSNTGASTINAGPSAVPLVRNDGSSVQAGDLPAGSIVSAIYDSSTNKVWLTSVVNSQTLSISTADARFVKQTQILNSLSGLVLSNDGTSPNTVLDIEAGAASDSTNTYIMELPSFTKNMNAVFAAGTGNGGLYTSALSASTWYHVFLIRNTSSGNSDVYADTSITADNIPSGWSSYRRIGSFKTDSSSHILPFTQHGDRVIWSTSILELSAVHPATTRTLKVLGGVPPGIATECLLRVSILANASNICHVIITSPFEADQDLSATSTLTATYIAPACCQISQYTDTSAQIGYIGDYTDILLYVSTFGYVDTRGRLS